jgi:transcription elongation factor Elf1
MTTESKVQCPRCGSERLGYDSEDNPATGTLESTVCKVCGLWWWTTMLCPTCGHATVAWDVNKQGVGFVHDCWTCGWQLKESINGPPFIHEEKAGVWPKS